LFDDADLGRANGKTAGNAHGTVIVGVVVD
jgi:hypothetical protein